MSGNAHADHANTRGRQDHYDAIRRMGGSEAVQAELRAEGQEWSRQVEEARENATSGTLILIGEVCNYCGRGEDYNGRKHVQINYNKELRVCGYCYSVIEDETPTAEPGHPFPHNHKREHSHEEATDPWICNYCGDPLRYYIHALRCRSCDSVIEDKTPVAENGHPFPHNHEPLRTCHQDSA